MHPLLEKVSGNRNFRQTSLLTTGTLVNSLLGLLYYLVVARILGVSTFGQFSFLLAVGLIAAEIGDLGLSSSLVKFGSGDKFNRLFSLTLLERVLAGIVLIALAILWYLATGSDFLPSAGLAISTLFFSAGLQGSLARQDYGNYVFSNILANVFRLALLAFLIFTANLTALTAIYIFVLANFAGFVSVLIALYRKEGRSPITLSGWQLPLREVFSYSFWIAASFSLSSLADKIDIPIVFALAGSQAAGLYSSAQKLTSVLPQIAASVEGVFSPKFSSGTEGFRRNFLDYFTVVMFISFGILVFLPFTGIAVSLLFGAKYLPAVPVFDLLLVSFLPFFASGPFSAAILYRYGKSSYHLAVNAVMLVISLVLYYLLVPGFGQTGAAWVSILTNTLFLFLYLVFFLRMTETLEKTND